jgi:alcohol dehydrogenase, propanol-preferring
MGDASELPKVGKAACVTKFGPDFEVTVREDVPVPEPASGQVLLKLTTTGICYSDLHYMLEVRPRHFTAKNNMYKKASG